MSSFLKVYEDCQLYFYFGIFSKTDLSFIKSAVDYCCRYLKISQVYPKDEVLTRLARILKIYECVINPKNKRHSRYRYV